MSWIVCQIGAREHYAIPRALEFQGALGALVTDFWVPPGSVLGRMPSGQRMRDRWHSDLAAANVVGLNRSMLPFEIQQRISKASGWESIQRRNDLFQRAALGRLRRLDLTGTDTPTLFSYSYAALDLFRFATAQGWRTVLGQIDPGPEEERIVEQERRRYASIETSWQPAPKSYWESWKEETKLADRIVVNSPWSKECLLKEGVEESKMEIIPLVYETSRDKKPEARRERWQGDPLRVLFLGQINLRKGAARLMDAMRILIDDPVELVLAGPSELPEALWQDLPKVSWVGPVPRSEVARYYQEADVFILPTLSDGYALTQLEALANGLPVLASTHCGEAVIDGVNGWILQDLEPVMIADKLREIASLPRSQAWTDSEFGVGELADCLRKAEHAVR